MCRHDTGNLRVKAAEERDGITLPGRGEGAIQAVAASETFPSVGLTAAPDDSGARLWPAKGLICKNL